MKKLRHLTNDQLETLKEGLLRQVETLGGQKTDPEDDAPDVINVLMEDVHLIEAEIAFKEKMTNAHRT